MTLKVIEFLSTERCAPGQTTKRRYLTNHGRYKRLETAWRGLEPHVGTRDKVPAGSGKLSGTIEGEANGWVRPVMTQPWSSISGARQAIKSKARKLSTKITAMSAKTDAMCRSLRSQRGEGALQSIADSLTTGHRRGAQFPTNIVGAVQCGNRLLFWISLDVRKNRDPHLTVFYERLFSFRHLRLLAFVENWYAIGTKNCFLSK